jgi:hypothetical protein
MRGIIAQSKLRITIAKIRAVTSKKTNYDQTKIRANLIHLGFAQQLVKDEG